jgi:hypothetical protein
MLHSFRSSNLIQGVIADHLNLACDEGHWLGDLQVLAQRYTIDIVAGTIVERSPNNSAHLFNTYVPGG